jgi:CRP-like cAMP-binding protein
MAGQNILHSDELQDKILVVISGAVSVHMMDKDRKEQLG